MKKLMLVAAVCSLPFASAFAGSAKVFECTGSNLPNTPFQLEMNSGIMPLEAQEGKSVAVEYTAEGLSLIVTSDDGKTRTVVAPDQYGYTTYVDGGFYVVCKASQQ